MRKIAYSIFKLFPERNLQEPALRCDPGGAEKDFGPWAPWPDFRCATGLQLLGQLPSKQQVIASCIFKELLMLPSLNLRSSVFVVEASKP